MRKTKKIKKTEEEIKNFKKDKNSPFYSMILHEKDYIYLQTRWERYLKNRNKLEEFKSLPLDKFDVSEYNLICMNISNCKDLILNFLKEHSMLVNVKYMERIFRKYKK